MRSQNLGFRQDALADVTQAVRSHNVHREAQQILKIQLQSNEIEQAPALLELDQEIDVALFAVVAPGYRAEDPHVVSAMHFRQVQDLHPLFLTQCGQGDHSSILPHLREFSTQFLAGPPPATLVPESLSDFFRLAGVIPHGAGALIFRAVEDADLIRKARRGDVEAYNLLVSRWERRVYNYLLRIVGHREDALDLSQDVFLKAYQHLGKLDDPARFGPWLYRIAHNEAYSLFRKRRPEGESEEIQPETLEGAASVGGNAVFPIELTLAVASALSRLNADQRETVVLKIYQGFKFEEIAEIVAAPVSTVKSRLYTALELLKAELAPVKARGAS